MLSIAIYTSAHGYGHATRSFEVAKALTQYDPNTHVHFMTWVPKEVFTSDLLPRIKLRRLKLDAGIRQDDSLKMDIAGTLSDLGRLETEAEQLIEQEAAFLRQEKISLVLADLPHLAFEAAAKAGLRAYGLSNFTWDWIYKAYWRDYPDFQSHIQRIRNAYRLAEALFLLPFNGSVRCFRKIWETPLIARRSLLGKIEARRRLKLRPESSVALFSFGGFGLDLRLKGKNVSDVTLLSTDPSPDPGFPFQHLTANKLKSLGLRYPDLVAAADAVVSKPGYGIVSECIANRTALLYLPRGDFREYPVLVHEMKSFIPIKPISLQSLETGRWAESFRMISQSSRYVEPPCDGAEFVAKKLLEQI